MAKEIDALVLTGYAYNIANSAPRYVKENVGQGLWYIRSGATQWYNGQPITEQDKAELYSAEVFLSLGDLAAMRYFGYDASIHAYDNPRKQEAIDSIDEISPLRNNETLNLRLNLQPFRRLRVTESTIQQSLDEILSKNQSAGEELNRKWQAAREVETRRGMVAIRVYSLDKLATEISKVDLGNVAPDTVTFDDELNVTSEAYNVKDLADKAAVRPKQIEVPYYSTFSRKIAPEMLTSALEDLRQIGHALHRLE